MRGLRGDRVSIKPPGPTIQDNYVARSLVVGRKDQIQATGFELRVFHKRSDLALVL